MAHQDRRRPENIAGNFYVDDTCIDCDACRWIAPETFQEDGGQSAVYRQPDTEAGKRRTLQALVACPTASIGVVDAEPLMKEAAESFPDRIDWEVYHCGYHSEASYGAASYFIRRKDGNVLVDSPRFAAPLVKRLEALGGVRYLYLTHRDDVADHALFREKFSCERILHEADLDADTQGVEIKLKGTSEFRLADDLLIIPVPGHTRGHTVLLHQNTHLFTGDHLAWSAEGKRLIAFRGATWYSWEELKKSMRSLAGYQFEWVLPGHGRRFHAPADAMKEEMQKCLKWLET